MKQIISSLIPTRWRTPLRDYFGEHVYGKRSYSQEGEDLVLHRLFEGQRSGVYVDVGAHHPFRFSNTCLLHKQGWRGVNIDAMPGSMTQFQRFRPRDINLELGVAAIPAELQYFVFQEPALNTFDPALAKEREGQGWPMIDTKKVQCLPLAQILERELPKLDAQGVDLLTVDVEGLDLDVLRSNDWARFRPKAVVVEVLNRDLAGVIASDISDFCLSVGYRPSAKLHHSVVFLRSE